ncbi:hypothetical protein Acr_00g0083280 [Actinidia rufa]|uniref:Uncharacterized protein n=1 Tax=Actinidia rufa TaxID=165716 RepID=A0A7J0DUT6_9ERIC|nr:hypothetical protein Acr_00g0083280 [Actinidia rufa]
MSSSPHARKCVFLEFLRLRSVTIVTIPSLDDILLVVVLHFGAYPILFLIRPAASIYLSILYFVVKVVLYEPNGPPSRPEILAPSSTLHADDLHYFVIGYDLNPKVDLTNSVLLNDPGRLKYPKKKHGKSLYAKATDTGINPEVAAKRFNIDWDTAANIEDLGVTDDTEVPSAMGYGALYQ